MTEPEHAALIESAIAHMNADHTDNLRDYARGLAQLAWAERAQIIALDQQGFTLHVEGHGRSAETRIVFDAPWAEAATLRRAMVTLAQRARTQLVKEPDANSAK